MQFIFIRRVVPFSVIRYMNHHHQPEMLLHRKEIVVICLGLPAIRAA
jgi:hypothetical protein